MLIFHNPALKKRILNTAAPAMLEMILYMVVGLADIAFVGRLGAAPLAAVALGSEIFFSIIIFMAALSTGSTILAAQAKGAQQPEDVNRVAGYTYVLGLLIGLVTGGLLFYFAPHILSLFKVEPDVYQSALDYLLITFAITPCALTLFMSNSIFRGLGRTQIPMLVALVQNIVNLLGDYVLVFGKWGFPQMGVAGAALATSLTQVLGFTVVTFLLFSGRGGVKVKWRLLWPIKKPLFREIFILGLPTLAEQFFNTLSALLSTFLVVYLGTLAFASHQVAINVESLSFMPGMGIAIAATALVGQAVGAGDNRNSRLAARGSVEMGMLLMGCIGLLFAFFPQQVVSIFTNDAEVIEIAAKLIRIAALEQLTIAFAMVASGILKGLGNTRTPLLISAGFTWLYRFPLMYLIIRIWGLDINLIWWLFVSDWLLRSLVYIVILSRRNWSETRSWYSAAPAD